MGRGAAGVNAIRLQGKDEVAGMDVIDDDLHTHILVVTQKGFGKRTPIEQYTLQARYGLGNRTLARNDRTGEIVAMRCINAGDGIMIISKAGVVIRTTLDQIRETGRSTIGVTVIDLGNHDEVAGIAILNNGDEDDEEGGEMIAIAETITTTPEAFNGASEAPVNNGDA